MFSAISERILVLELLCILALPIFTPIPSKSLTVAAGGGGAEGGGAAVLYTHRGV